MVHGGMALVKYLLFIFNFLFWLSGIGLVILGVYIQIAHAHYVNFLGEDALAAPVLIIAVGVVVALLGFFGCCGAIRENYCMTMTFAVLLGVLLVLELAAGIASYVLREEVTVMIKERMVDGMTRFEQPESKGITNTWNDLQIQFQCCGANNYTDWEHTISYQGSPNVPHSCCRKEKKVQKDCHEGVRGPNYEHPINETIYTKGCVDEFRAYAELHGTILGGIALGFATFQVICIVVTCIYNHFLVKTYFPLY